MKTLLKHIGSGFTALLFSAFWAAGYGQSSLLLSSSKVSSSNYVQLHWTWTPAKPSGNYSFTLFQWDNTLGDWQSTSVKCDDTIRVLNVYPNIAGSNTLKTWMDDPAIGFGKILVTPVTLTNFNSNSDSYLKNGSGEYIYDVIMFGSWDAYNNQDLNIASTTAVRTFLDAGRGVLFGHDTQFAGVSVLNNFASLSDKTNLYIPAPRMDNLMRGSTSIKVINDGVLLKYPHYIPYNTTFTIPFTHTTGQLAKGIVWINFPNTVPAYPAGDTIINGGTNNFYLTTWNNAAMIQTGHSNGQSTTYERKILANTLWYLAQFTNDTTADVCYAPDVTPPAAPIADWSTICGQINILACDSGTVYKFYVKATNMINSNDTVISNTLTVENKSGLRGYFISEDANPNGVPTVTRDTSNNIITPLTIIAADSQQVIYTIQNPNFYIHIQAVDSAGNLSAVTTLKASDLQSVTTFYDTICANNPYTNHNFNISASKLQTAGNFEFRDTIPSTTGACDTVIVLKLNVIECCQTQLVTVRFKPDSAIGQDAVIFSTNGCTLSTDPMPADDLNYDTDPEFKSQAWTHSSFGCAKGTMRSLLKFDELATIPANAVIIRVELKLYGVTSSGALGNSCYPNSGYNSYCPNTSFIQKITSTWNKRTVTWNTQPTTTTVNQITISQSATQFNWNYTDSSANLLAMVQDWVQNPTTNFGIMIRLATEDYYRAMQFASSNHSNTALHPELIVTYELKQGGKKDTTELNETICDGEIYSENGFNDSISGTYTHNLQNRFGCDSTVILNLYVATKDIVSIFDTICDGKIYSQNGFNASKSGIYTQNLQNIFGCDSLVELNLTVKQTPDIEIVAITDNFCDKDFVEIQLITNGDSFLWSTGSSENPITVTKSGIYSATAFIKDCEKTAEYTVEECPCELWLPNVFTPNNDGVNDDFIPVVRANLASFSMYIYDRWGQIIYKTDSYAPWDGTCNGRFASAGVYFCVISYSCANAPEKILNKQGSVTLLR